MCVWAWGCKYDRVSVVSCRGWAGHMLSLCISAQLGVVPTVPMYSKNWKRKRHKRCGECCVNGGGSSGILVSMVCEFSAKALVLRWFWGTGHIYIYIPPFRNGWGCLCALICCAAPITLHIQSIYKWFCGSMFPAHHRYAWLHFYYPSPAAWYLQCLSNLSCVLVVDCETVQEHCLNNLVLEHVVVGYTT